MSLVVAARSSEVETPLHRFPHHVACIMGRECLTQKHRFANLAAGRVPSDTEDSGTVADPEGAGTSAGSEAEEVSPVYPRRAKRARSLVPSSEAPAVPADIPGEPGVAEPSRAEPEVVEPPETEPKVVEPPEARPPKPAPKYPARVIKFTPLGLCVSTLLAFCRVAITHAPPYLKSPRVFCVLVLSCMS
jgi:hypothetical protein